MGIVTADGVPMILVYSPKCTPLETERTYSRSTVDNKPETNATTNCISAIMDVNGNKKPNKIGKDVRTWNSLFASRDFGDNYTPLAHKGNDQYECKQLKDKLGINNCRTDAEDDYWGGAVKKCHELGLHLPSTQTLALAAGARYGRSDITPYTILSSVQFAKDNFNTAAYQGLTCEQTWRKIWREADQINCIDNGSNTNMEKDDNTASISFSGHYWSASESSDFYALLRTFYAEYSHFDASNRSRRYKLLCVGD